jgi:uncharacterized membrane protein YbhN (UPF0104 family)
MRRVVVPLAISVAIMGLLVARTRPWDALSVGSIDGRLLAVAVAANAVVVAAWAFRSSSLMQAVGYPIRPGPIVPVVSFANTVNNLTPASSGEVLRAMILRRRYGVPYPASIAVILVERFWAIGVMAVSAAAAAAGSILGFPAPLVVVAWVIALAASAAPAAVGRMGFRPARWLASALDQGPARPGLRGRAAAVLRDVDEHLVPITHSTATSARFLGWTTVIFVAYAIQLQLVISALGGTIDVGGAWAAVGLATVAGVLSALPFGLGAADAVLIGLLAVQGIPAATAAAVVLLLRVVATLPLGVAGSISWIVLSRSEARTA